MTIKQQLRTVAIFTKLSTKRFFRDKTALFFGILFPLIFLFVFGSLNSSTSSASFNVAVINQAKADQTSQFAKDYTKELYSSKVFKVDKTIYDYKTAKDKLTKSQIDGIIILPKSFGALDANNKPTGQAQVIYARTSSGSGQTLTSVLNGTFTGVNQKLGTQAPPFTVKGTELNEKSLSAFDYTFAGLLGFSIIGIGIFGPMNVFPELKKQGILRRLRTTPLKVWQYFLATALSYSTTGIISIAIQFAVAIAVFNLHVVGNYFEIAAFIVFAIFMILGIGLAIGGWAKNERQAAPLGNVIVFPMLFLSGTFFPRFLMPTWLQDITAYLPLSPVIDGLRLLTTEGKHLIDLGPQLGIMALWFVVIYAIAFRVFKWE